MACFSGLEACRKSAPSLSPSLTCIGCGGCEFICPARPLRAIHVEGLAVQGKAKPFEEQEKEEKEINSFGF